MIKTRRTFRKPIFFSLPVPNSQSIYVCAAVMHAALSHRMLKRFQSADISTNENKNSPKRRVKNSDFYECLGLEKGRQPLSLAPLWGLLFYTMMSLPPILPQSVIFSSSPMIEGPEDVPYKGKGIMAEQRRNNGITEQWRHSLRRILPIHCRAIGRKNKLFFKKSGS